MRFLSSRFRTAAEILLTVAVLAYVTYDLVDRSGGGKPTASADPAVSSVAAHRSSSSSSSSASPSSSSSSFGAPAALGVSRMPTGRFEALVDPTITPNNTFYICGATLAAADPWVIGGTGNLQALIVLGTPTGYCSSTGTLMGANNLTYAGVTLRRGSWLSLQNILPTGGAITAFIGRLVADAGSYIEAIFPVGYQPEPMVVRVLQLLKSEAACPSFTGVNFIVPNCISAPQLATVGAYACYLTSTPDAATCTISLTIVGALSAQATSFINALLGTDCSVLTQATFKQTIQLVTTVPAEAILVTYWQCGSIVVYFTVLGGTVAQANVALNLIYISMSSGLLHQALSVVSVSIGRFPNPAANSTYTTVTVNYPYSYPYVLPYLVPYSQSNPGLLALLTLLLIPVGIALALLLWCACRPVKKPVPPPCPCPCPAPYMPLPTCMPAACPPPVVCEPMCAPMACEPMCAPMMPMVSEPVCAPAPYPPAF